MWEPCYIYLNVNVVADTCTGSDFLSTPLTLTVIKITNEFCDQCTWGNKLQNKKEIKVLKVLKNLNKLKNKIVHIWHYNEVCYCTIWYPLIDLQSVRQTERQMDRVISICPLNFFCMVYENKKSKNYNIPLFFCTKVMDTCRVVCYWFRVYLDSYGTMNLLTKLRGSFRKILQKNTEIEKQ